MSCGSGALSATECEQILEEIEVYLDGEVSPEECRRIEQHLADCPACFDREHFQRSLREIIRRKCGSAEMPAGLADRIRRAISSAD